MLRLAALLLASTMLVPLAVSAPPTVQSYSTFTADQFRSIAGDLLLVPEIASALPEGSVITFVVKAWEERDDDRRRIQHPAVTFQGTVSGGQAAVSQGGSGTGDLQLSAYKEFWGALMNACDRGNTAKLGIRDRYVGIDGGSAAKAAANGIRTGQFDAQLAAQRPTAGQPFPCAGATPTLNSEQTRADFWEQNSRDPALWRQNILLAQIEGRTYIINKLGGIEGQLPSGWLAATVHDAFPDADLRAAANHGTKPVPAECRPGDGGTQWWRTYVIATCLNDRRARGLS